MRYIEIFLGFFIKLFHPEYYLTVKIHYQQNKEFSPVQIKASYTQFKKAFKRAGFNYRIQYEGEYGFYKVVGTKCIVSECFASVIEFNNVGYNLTTFGFYFADKYIKKQFSELTCIPLIER